ncbi:hypothetical protein Bca4012_009359 [Brassica carinata]|uniref:Replication protein A 70 kDa DNA-binding subunit B/D first OB fold domain-containing protein n=1 Tax=Brassica carinata TaxID=52824 RepID=A0A8X7V1Y6_BRACI|nr:hypothetical protein Bca52824_034628 [Brassica carinata]
MSAFTLLSDLQYEVKKPAIRVHVISKWRTKTSETELLVGDEMGFIIQGTFHDECMESNKISIKEGEWYEIYDFKLIYNFRKVKATTNRYHFVTKVNTVITNCGLLKHVDIYGSLLFLGNLEFVEEAAGIVKPKTTFSLINPENAHNNCVAYGTNAVELHAYWNSTKANVVLCVLSVWRIEWDEGRFRYMTNIEGCSKIVLEPNIPEIEEFRKRIPAYVY